MGHLTYVLITPARNEARYIEATIKSVVRQTVPPTRWIIVSDGSNDGTDDIVKRYAAEYEWIELVRIPEGKDRNFAAKVKAFNAGYERIRSVAFEVIGNLDADISFGPDYFAFLLERFAESQELGVAGTPFVENGFQYDFRFVSIDHVSGACQLFRRKCFEDIGGYKPIKEGGVDLVAVTTARMMGWRTRTFTERRYLHQRTIGTSRAGMFMAKFRVGQQDYYLGSHPLWEVLRSLYQMKFRPYVLGGTLIFMGYAWSSIRSSERRVGQELMEFRRNEQKQRLKKILLRMIGLSGVLSER